MAGIIKVDEIEKSSDTGTGIKLNSPLLNSTGTEIMSDAGSITIPSGQSIRNSSGTEIISAAGALSGVNFVGMIAPFAMSSSPSGWLPCQGGEVLIDDYLDLYDLIGTTWNTTIDPTTGSAHSTPASGNFRLPDFRGSFLRGVGTALNKDATSLAGYQGEKTKVSGQVTASSSISGGQFPRTPAQAIANRYNSYASSTGWLAYTWQGTGLLSRSVSTSLTGQNETRPLNFGVYYWIKY